MNFVLDGDEYEVVVEKKPIKNLYIRVTNNLEIKISAPFIYTNKMIMNIINEQTPSIKKMILRQKKKNNNALNHEKSFLGNKLNVFYKNVKTPTFSGNDIYVKDDAMLNNWYKNMANKIFKNYLDEAYYVFDEKIPYPKIKVRQMKTRWGVCNKKDISVTLNLELIKMDQKFLNYVIIHELCHFIYFDHSKSFWKKVEKYCPEYKLVRKQLKE